MSGYRGFEDLETGLTRDELLKWGAGVAVSATALGQVGGALAAPAREFVRPRRGGVLRLAFSDVTTKESLDPALTGYRGDATLSALIFESLTYFGSDWVPRPLLAKGWRVSSDAKKWTFVLRNGVHFHDGTRLTAKDVVYSIRRLLNKSVGSALYARLSPVLSSDGVRAVGDDTVVFRLSQPDAFLPLALGTRLAHIVKAGTKEFTPRTMIGTGPFKLKSYRPAESWEVVRNPRYWQRGLPYLDGVRMVGIPEQATKIQAVIAGNADLSDDIDFSAAATVRNNSRVNVLRLKGSLFFEIVMDSAQAPFTDSRIPAAIKIAVDRKRVLNTAFQGSGVASGDTLEPPPDPFYPPQLGVPKQNIANAKRLLAQAGYPNGIDVELITSPSLGGQVDIAVAFAQVVAPAGIRVKIKQWPAETFWDQVWLHKPMYVNYWNRRHPSEILPLGYTKGAVWNMCHVDSPKLGRLVAQGRSAVTTAAQRRIYRKALLLIAQKYTSSIPAFIDRSSVAKKRVHGVELEIINGFTLRKAWLSG